MSPHIIEHGHGITQLDAEYQAPGVAALYLLQQGERVAIIDTGTAFSVPHILQVLEARGLDASAVAYVIPTHVHLDHAGGVGELMHVCPAAQLVIHPYGARHMIDPAKLIAGSIAVYGEQEFKRLYGELRPVPGHRVIEAPDNFKLELEGRILNFVDAPGHARHHFCVHDPASGSIFTGDAFGLSYPPFTVDGRPFIFATCTPVQFDPEAMLNTIGRLMALSPQRFYLTHFGVVAATPALAEQLKQTVRDFRDIALAEQANAEGRVQRIETRLMDYLLKTLAAQGCAMPDADSRRMLTMDAHLNAQGLEVWLQRQAV